MSAERASRRKLFVFALIIGTCLVIGIVLIVKGYLTMGWVNDQIDTLEDVLNRPYGPVLYLIGTVAFILLQIPGIVPVVLGALVYGLGEAFILTMIGINIGITGTFLLARYFLRDYFAPKLERSRFHRFTRRLETNGIITMTFLRIGLWMFPPMNWAIGATNIKIRDYIIGCVIGLAPIIFAIQLTTKKLQSIQSTRDLLQPETIAVVLGFVVFLIAVLLIRRRYFSAEESQFSKEA
jgi:uncharacterized membrane protein YdjX (TVP38/TMEM64 family)